MANASAASIRETSTSQSRRYAYGLSLSIVRALDHLDVGVADVPVSVGAVAAMAAHVPLPALVLTALKGCSWLLCPAPLFGYHSPAPVLGYHSLATAGPSPGAAGYHSPDWGSVWGCAPATALGSHSVAAAFDATPTRGTQVGAATHTHHCSTAESHLEPLLR